MKKILFPTDFSAPANNAFVYALQLADKLNASITTLHAFSHPEIHIERGGIHPEALEHVYESIDMDEFENYRDSIPALRDIAEKENLTLLPFLLASHGTRQQLEKIATASSKSRRQLTSKKNHGASIFSSPEVEVSLDNNKVNMEKKENETFSRPC